jgi:hypothetical protein
MRVLAALFGIFMLLPGLCSLGFMAMILPGAFSGRASDVDGALLLLWIVCFGVSFCGILLIRFAFTGHRNGAPRDGAGGGANTPAAP